MKLLYAAALSLVVSLAHAQKHTISGSIKDAASGENLIGANIYNTSSHQGTTANNYGFYSITLQQDSIHLRISYVGYENQVVSFFLANDTTINFSLTSGSTLKEVVISGTVEDQIQETTRMGTIDVPLEQIKAMPALLGEVDVLKVLQLLPGVPIRPDNWLLQNEHNWRRIVRLRKKSDHFCFNRSTTLVLLLSTMGLTPTFIRKSPL